MGDNEFLAELDSVMLSKAARDEAASRPIIRGEYLDPDFSSNEDFWRLFHGQRYAYPLITESRSNDAIDRTASMLSGPFFTCEEYEWPSTDGLSWEPIVQIDLELARSVADAVTATGLIQVWRDPGGPIGQRQSVYDCLHIPKSLVGAERTTPLPNGIRHDPDSSHAWRGRDSETPPWLIDGIQILGTGKAALSLNYLIEDFLRNELEEMDDDYDADLQDRASLLADEFGGRNHIDGDYLLGNFYPIQFGPNLNPLLVNLGTEHFWWGDEGSAQLFYDPKAKDGGCWFDWSC